MNSSTCVPSTPGPLDSSAPVTTLGMNKDIQLSDLSSGVGSPSITPGVGAPKNPKVDSPKFIPSGVERILFIDSLPSNLDCSDFMMMFDKYGEIKVIRFCETVDFKFWRIWIEFACHKDALNAYECSSKENLKCILIQKIPNNIDVDRFYPSKNNQETTLEKKCTERKPLPARWLIISTKLEFCNLFKFRKHLRTLVGSLNNSDITRFGRNSFLVHAKSYRQGHMISNLKTSDIIKEVKPHYNFSYAKGVVFSQDIYELPHDELIDMCDDNVWKVFKVPKSKMTIFTFNSDQTPDFVYIDRERFHVKPYRHRPLQCFSCFGYGHSSKVCTKEMLCAACSFPKHEGECTNPIVCINCKESHNARSYDCKVFKNEVEAIEKAQTEHLSIGQAKRLLSSTPQFSNALKNGKLNRKDQSKKLNSESKLQLSPSELEVHTAPPSSSKKDHSSSPERTSSGFWEASQASNIEASQADSLPDLGNAQNNTLLQAPHTAQVHVMEKEPPNNKRHRTPSSSPPSSPHLGKAPKRGNSRSLEDLSSSSGKNRPSLSRPVNKKTDKIHKSNKDK